MALLDVSTNYFFSVLMCESFICLTLLSLVVWWPYTSVMRDMISLERALDEALDNLRSRLRQLRPDTELSNEYDDDDNDELDSIVSSTVNALSAPHRFVRAVRFGPSPREVDLLKKKLLEMEQENKTLRNEVDRLKSLCGHSVAHSSEEKKDDDSKDSAAHIRSEGGVLKVIRGTLSIS
jgi:hypothetical protein